MLQALKDAIASAIQTRYGVSGFDIKIERPPPGVPADYCWCVTQFAHQIDQDKDTSKVAKEIASLIATSPVVEKVSTYDDFVNIHLADLYTAAFEGIAAQAVMVEKPQRIMVEFISPNTNKDWHFGHWRNAVIGVASTNILAAVGHSVIRIIHYNNRGDAIAKAMLGRKYFGQDQTPESTGMKGDRLAASWYVAFETAFEKQVADLVAQGMKEDEAKKRAPLKLETDALVEGWERGDEEIMADWRDLNALVHAGFAVTEKRIGVVFDKRSYESDVYELGRSIVEEGLARGIFVRADNGAVYYPLPEDEFGLDRKKRPYKAVLLRGNGTTLYPTQDLGLAKSRFEEEHLDRLIYVVGDEQIDHFRHLFAIFKALGFPWADRCYHLSYGMVLLPDGKMKSRKGNVVTIDGQADEMQRLAAAEIRKGLERDREDLPESEILRRAEVIGQAAVKFFFLNYTATTWITFRKEQSLSFEGDTGPYLLYTLARLRGVVAKGSAVEGLTTFYKLVHPAERELARELLDFPTAVMEAAEGESPNITLFAKRLMTLARAANSFYTNADCRILSEPDLQLRSERLALADSAAEAIRWGLELLGIEWLDEM